jgi:two-component system LytT family response regulator
MADYSPDDYTRTDHSLQDLLQARMMLEYFLQTTEPIPHDAVLNTEIVLAGKTFLASNVLYCEAEGNYTHLHYGSREGEVLELQTHCDSRKLKHWQTVLRPPHFLRCHNSFLVNLHYIYALHNTPNGTALIVCKDGTKLTVSRSYKAKFLQQCSAKQKEEWKKNSKRKD